MPSKEKENHFSLQKENLENQYGPNAFVSTTWLKQEFAQRKKAKGVVGAKGAKPSAPSDKQALRPSVFDREPLAPPIVPLSKDLQAVRTDLGDCQRCKLCKTRTHIVFGEGNPKAQILFIGEGPGESEDLQGRPFVGRAGQLLDKIIEAMGLKRTDVYIANVVKCRPPENRVPEPDEVASCSPFLQKQIDAIRPKVIVALGGTALKRLLGDDAQISKYRGKFVPYSGTKLMPTFHPAYLLRNPSAKKEVWEDMKVVLSELGMKARA